MTVVTRSQSKLQTNNNNIMLNFIEYPIMSENNNENDINEYIESYLIERREKLSSALLVENNKFFVVGASDNDGLNYCTMRLFDTIVDAKKYSDEIKKTNDFTEFSLVTKSGEFIYLLNSEIRKLLEKNND